MIRYDTWVYGFWGRCIAAPTDMSDPLGSGDGVVSTE